MLDLAGANGRRFLAGERPMPRGWRKLVSNLLNNAAKFSPLGGRVDLSVARSDSEIVLSVRDHGVGIAPEMIDRVFEPFVQAVFIAPQRTGWGWPHPGEAAGRDARRQGRGAERRARPGQRVPGVAPRAPPRQWGEQLRRGADRASFASPGVASWWSTTHRTPPNPSPSTSLLGCQVQVVNDGRAGLAAVEQTPPEIVFLDLRMPGMSGLDVARQLRRGQGANRMVLVATTGDGQPEDRPQTTEAGFDYHLTKPMDIAQLLAITGGPRIGRPTSTDFRPRDPRTVTRTASTS